MLKSVESQGLVIRSCERGVEDREEGILSWTFWVDSGNKSLKWRIEVK